jgi:hypothetical protein
MKDICPKPFGKRFFLLDLRMVLPGLIGYPHPGQNGALSDTSLLHSGQFISIFITSYADCTKIL